MIALFVECTMNVLKDHGIVDGPMGRTAKGMTVFAAPCAAGIAKMEFSNFGLPRNPEADKPASEFRQSV